MRRGRACASLGLSRQQEEPRVAAALIIDAPRREEAGVRGETLIVRGGARSMLARQLSRASIWGRRLESKTYPEVVSALLAAAAQYQLVRSGHDQLRRRGLAARGQRRTAGRHGWSCRRPCRESVFHRALPHARGYACERGRGAFRHRRPRAHRAGRSGSAGMAGMALPLGRRGSRQARREERAAAPCG